MGETGRANEGRDLGEAPDRAVWDVFLSYAAEDSEWAKAVESKLTDSGLRVFSAYTAPEQFWGRSMDEIISEVFPDECPVASVVLSRAYSFSENCLRELEAIAAATAAGKPALVLPVRLDDSPTPESIRSVAALDARAVSADEVARRIAARVEEMKQARADEPAHEFRSAFEAMTVDALAILLGGRARLEVARLMRRMPEADAEDVVQDAMLSVLKSFQRRQISDPLADFKHVVRVKAFDRRKSNKMRPRAETALVDRQAALASVDSPAAPEEEEDLDRVKSALESLGDEERQIIELHYWEGLTVREVAERLDIPEPFARLRLRRALSKLVDVIKVGR